MIAILKLTIKSDCSGMLAMLLSFLILKNYLHSCRSSIRFSQLKTLTLIIEDFQHQWKSFDPLYPCQSLSQPIFTFQQLVCSSSSQVHIQGNYVMMIFTILSANEFQVFFCPLGEK